MATQIFVMTTAGTPANTGFGSNAAFDGNSAGEVGLWSLDLGDHIDGGSAAQALVTDAEIVPTRFQITQMTSTIPYASPIIDSSRVRKITYKVAVPAVAATTSGTNTVSLTTADAQVGIKIVEKASPVDYNNFLNPRFPKIYDRVGKVHTYHYTLPSSGATAASTCQGVVDAINADPEAIVTASLANTSDITIAAKDINTGFQIIDMGLAGVDGYTGLTYSAGSDISGVYAGTPSVGDGVMVASEEQKNLGYQTGYHNRLHLPQTPSDLYAVAGTDYDCITLFIDQPEGGKKSAVGNDELIIKIFFTAAAAASGTNIDGIFQGGTIASSLTWAEGTDSTLYTRG